MLLSAIASAQIGNIVVTSAANFAPGLPPPESIGSIFCTGISVTGTVSAPQNQPLPYMLAGVTVTVGGLAAPLFAVANFGGYQQINFQVPVGSGGSTNVSVSQNGIEGSADVSKSSSPGDFFQLSGTQFGVFQHASDYTLVTPDNPASPGESLIGYATGLPTPSPAVPTGQAVPLSPLYPVPQTAEGLTGTTLNLLVQDNVPLSVGFMGLAPGEVGVYQINFTLDPNSPPGNLPLKIVQQVCGAAALTVVCNPLEPGANVQFYNGGNALIPVR